MTPFWWKKAAAEAGGGTDDVAAVALLLRVGVLTVVELLVLDAEALIAVAEGGVTMLLLLIAVRPLRIVFVRSLGAAVGPATSAGKVRPMLVPVVSRCAPPGTTSTALAVGSRRLVACGAVVTPFTALYLMVVVVVVDWWPVADGCKHKDDRGEGQNEKEKRFCGVWLFIFGCVVWFGNARSNAMETRTRSQTQKS